MSNKDEVTRVLREIEGKFAPVRELRKDESKLKKAIVIVADYCGEPLHIVYNYTNEVAIESEVTQEIGRLTSQGHKNIRVIKGIELEYPFKIA